MIDADPLKYSRSRGAAETLRAVAIRPSSALKRTDREAGLSPAQDRSGTRPASLERLEIHHTVGAFSDSSVSLPRVMLGTPLPPTQQHAELFRPLAPSPPVQRTAHPIVLLSNPASTRNGTTRVDHAYLADRYHKGGRDSQDSPSKVEARVMRSAIQRDHRPRRRAGETVSLTPTISQLVNVEGPDVAAEGIHPYDEG